MTEYNWISPAGTYVVPAGFKQRFLSDFPDYRIRWSLQHSKWLVEQKYDNPLPATKYNPFNDEVIRERDGYWLVSAFQPGDRMACPAWVYKAGGQRCGQTLYVPTRDTIEVVCSLCRRNGRDGRTIAGYWPFDECLLEVMRRTNPLSYGTQKIDGKLRVVASAAADSANAAFVKEGERQLSDVVTSSTIESFNRQVGIAQIGFTGKSSRLIHSNRTDLS